MNLHLNPGETHEPSECSRHGPDVLLNWSGGLAPFVIERTTALSPPEWQPMLTNSQSSATLPPSDPAGFFRVRAQGL